MKIFCAMYVGLKHEKDPYAMPPFYESLVGAFRDFGNSVMCYIHSNWNKDFSGEMPTEIKKTILDFDADLYIFFNNNFWDVSEYVDKPIVIFDVDSPMFWKNSDKVSEKKDRYHYMTIQSGIKDVIVDQFHVDRKKICFVAPFTAIRADKSVEQNVNISFVGTNWGGNGCRFLSEFMSKDVTEEEVIQAKSVFEAYTKDPFMDCEELYADSKEIVHKLIPSAVSANASRISGVRRLHHLEVISDLGLEIRGVNWADASVGYFPGVAFSFNKEQVLTLAENQALYNRSKIGFNINHIQATTGFSWRVCEIMASNACLVAEYKPDMKTAFPGVNLPMYSSPYEARELCKKLLEDNDMREQIVCAAHEVIDAKYRPENAIANMENFLGFSLHGDLAGKVEFVKDQQSQPNKTKTASAAGSSAAKNQNTGIWQSLLVNQKISKEDKVYSVYDQRKITDYKTIVISCGVTPGDQRTSVTIPAVEFIKGRTYYCNCFSNHGKTFHQNIVVAKSPTQVLVKQDCGELGIVNIYGQV